MRSRRWAASHAHRLLGCAAHHRCAIDERTRPPRSRRDPPASEHQVRASPSRGATSPARGAIPGGVSAAHVPGRRTPRQWPGRPHGSSRRGCYSRQRRVISFRTAAAISTARSSGRSHAHDTGPARSACGAPSPHRPRTAPAALQPGPAQARGRGAAGRLRGHGRARGRGGTGARPGRAQPQERGAPAPLLPHSHAAAHGPGGPAAGDPRAPPARRSLHRGASRT
jgi:hypothetical protein